MVGVRQRVSIVTGQRWRYEGNGNGGFDLIDNEEEVIQSDEKEQIV